MKLLGIFESVKQLSIITSHSKDDLYFATLKWECENFIDQVKIILERDSDSLTQKLTDYFGQKEVVSENNKLIHEALLTFFNEKSFRTGKRNNKLDVIKESRINKTFFNKTLFT